MSGLCIRLRKWKSDRYSWFSLGFTTLVLTFIDSCIPMLDLDPGNYPRISFTIFFFTIITFFFFYVNHYHFLILFLNLFYSIIEIESSFFNSQSQQSRAIVLGAIPSSQSTYLYHYHKKT